MCTDYSLFEVIVRGHCMSEELVAGGHVAPGVTQWREVKCIRSLLPPLLQHNRIAGDAVSGC